MAEWLRELAESSAKGTGACVNRSVTVAVQGPESRDLLRKIVWTAPHKFDQLVGSGLRLRGAEY
jgi:aminomethyltransferase